MSNHSLYRMESYSNVLSRVRSIRRSHSHARHQRQVSSCYEGTYRCCCEPTTRQNRRNRQSCDANARFTAKNLIELKDALQSSQQLVASLTEQKDGIEREHSALLVEHPPSPVATARAPTVLEPERDGDLIMASMPTNNG